MPRADGFQKEFNRFWKSYSVKTLGDVQNFRTMAFAAFNYGLVIARREFKKNLKIMNQPAKPVDEKSIKPISPSEAEMILDQKFKKRFRMRKPNLKDLRNGDVQQT